VDALVWHGDRSLELEELPDPVPAGGEVVLDVTLAGICGSDLHGYRGHPGPRVPPLVLGHEAVGLVDGDAYVLYPIVGCGDCERCRAGEDNLCDTWRLIGMHRPGVFAERVSVPERSLVAVPAGLPAERAVLAEPLACCVGALPADLGPTSRVLVLGCGPIGILTVFLAARAGAEVVAVDPVPERRALALRLGAARAVDRPSERDSGSFDHAVDAAGFEQTWRVAVESVRNGGSIVVVGLGQAEGNIPMATIVRRALRLRGQFAYSRREFAAAVEVLGAAELDLSWVEEMPLAAGAAAFADLVERPAEHAKVLLRP
jgi:threonine dehydrogenase-like Zn-dependent dehydrogenase